ncbi:MAG: LUD domain-containing protein [Myxococcota bacterium]
MKVDELIARVRTALLGCPVPPLEAVPSLFGPEVVAREGLLETFVAAARAAGAEVVVVDAREGATADAEGASAVTAVTEVACAIAVSGSIVLEGSPRLPSAWAETHVAIVRRSQIVATLGDYLARATEVRSRVVITGPSKTADIEGILVTGVHGPGRLVIRVIAEE